MAEAPIVLRNASASNGGRAVLSGIDLTIRPGERVSLLGRSGAGKSTLIGLIHAQAGGEAALVPQASALVRTLSVFHNVYMGRLDRHTTLHNLRNLVRPSKRDVADVAAILARVGLSEQIGAKAGALSGGQQQRVSVARALYDGRPILLGDEPVSALDRAQGGSVLQALGACHETLVVALHDVTLALAHTDRIVVLDSGRIVLDAPARDLDAGALAPYYEDRCG